ncbi:hypothetical protein KC332_g16003 [Hortaea werneckii]|uniref:Guanine nucleotide-binding protein-like 3 N-terminal domain-containing protein n=1 Tax=Hortaea werneckii TaxID=91943 RepID=A0A3M7IGS3_HORWE|nr:hypothetical protein KC350_g17450 [Hortaea werneckii]KAI6834459.1 hypothetical protein KC358_g5810 [Hortaea werneckii]KAI6920327.1 hypothetical protein KC341_g16669 [Hortaea werneckii]KAI6936074.1 hypothetical protein KC348_g6127 [Hortaea werneckii]KAI6954979.1 hypothetical protein KC321_g16035 [Hortaea werneckii]
MKVGKPTSKRTPTRLRAKIQKASTNKQKKQRRDAKKNPQWRSRLKKDPGVPNLFPQKAKVLAELEEKRLQKEEEQLKKRELAKAQRQGKVVAGEAPAKAGGDDEADEDEELIDPEAESGMEDEEMDVGDDSNPMAALLASAQARASAYAPEDDDDEDEDDDDDEAEELEGIDGAASSAPGNAQRKVLPKQVLADPMKAVSALVGRMQNTADGIQRILTFYAIPPLVTAGSNTTSRLLVEVARKRGRLGRGGVPNLHAAALIILNDLNEERLKLPAVANESKKASKAAGKGEVQVVGEAKPAFTIEGLFGDDGIGGDAMAIEK